MENKSFEELMNELEAIVNQLEKGNLPLDESVKMYQKGIEITNLLAKKLEEAKLVVEIKDE